MAEEKRAVKIPHNLILENRKSLNISGVSDVDSFGEFPMWIALMTRTLLCTLI